MTAPSRGDAAHALRFSAASQVARQLVQFGTNVVLARLLVPADFGLVAMAMVFVGLVGLVRDLGTGAAVVQRQELTPQLTSSVFWFNAAFGACATLLLVTVAPLIAALYDQSELTALLQVMSLALVISSLGVLQQALLQRHLEFRRLAYAEVSGAGGGAAASIVLAVLGAGAWSLVAGTVTAAATTTAVLWAASSWRPTVAPRRKEVRGVLGFSLNLTLFNVVNYFSRNADNFLVGKYLGAVDLGYYGLAYRLLLFPLSSVTLVVGRVLFPVLSRFQNDDERIGVGFLDAVQGIALITFPLMSGLVMLAGPFVVAVFGPRWAPAVPLVEVLAPVGMAQSVVAPIGSIFMAKGRTRLLAAWGIGSSLYVILGFVIGLRWGVLGVAVSYAISAATLMVPGYLIALRVISLSPLRLLRAFAGPLAATAIMAAVIAAARWLLPAMSPWGVLLVTVPLGIVTYFAASLVVNRHALRLGRQMLLGRRSGAPQAQ